MTSLFGRNNKTPFQKKKKKKWTAGSPWRDASVVISLADTGDASIVKYHESMEMI